MHKLKTRFLLPAVAGCLISACATQSYDAKPIVPERTATEFREHMNGWNADARHQNLLSWLASGYSSFIEDDFRILDENNPDVPLTLVLHYHGAFLLNGPRTFDYFPSLELSLLRFPEAAHRRLTAMHPVDPPQ